MEGDGKWSDDDDLNEATEMRNLLLVIYGLAALITFGIYVFVAA